MLLVLASPLIIHCLCRLIVYFTAYLYNYFHFSCLLMHCDWLGFIIFLMLSLHHLLHKPLVSRNAFAMSCITENILLLQLLHADC